MSDKELHRLVAGGLLVVVLLVALWVNGCQQYTRGRETACGAAGGALLRLPPLSATTDREMCARVTKFEFEQVPYQQP